VTAFWLKYQDRDRCLRRVTQPPHIAGPLGLIWAFRDLKYFVIKIVVIIL
jgi:hypothetical protein